MVNNQAGKQIKETIIKHLKNNKLDVYEQAGDILIRVKKAEDSICNILDRLNKTNNNKFKYNAIYDCDATNMNCACIKDKQCIYINFICVAFNKIERIYLVKIYIFIAVNTEYKIMFPILDRDFCRFDSIFVIKYRSEKYVLGTLTKEKVDELNIESNFVRRLLKMKLELKSMFFNELYNKFLITEE